MRTMYDSTTAADIPPDAAMVAGYVDGRYAWSNADWARFPKAIKVRISVLGTNDGHVLDIEDGAAYPTQAPIWTRQRRAAGVEPTLYVNLGNVAQVRFAFVAAGEKMPALWLAHYDNDPTLPAGYIAKQYANSDLTGGHYDASVVADYWEGVDDVTPDDVKAIIKDYLANTYGPALEDELVQRFQTEDDVVTKASIAASLKAAAAKLSA